MSVVALTVPTTHDGCSHPATDYAGGNCEAQRRGREREARGECYWCGQPGMANADWCTGCGDYCPGCRAELTGCAWGPRGVCLDCHERSLLPPEDFAAECVGLNRS